MLKKNCNQWSLVSREGADKLGRMEPFDIRRRLLLLEDLADLVADVVVQQLRPHHRHEHGANHDGHTHLVGDLDDRDVTSM